MTPEDADRAQAWLGMDGATALHLIDRHADNWNEAGEMMNAWLRANVIEERAACAKAAESAALLERIYLAMDAKRHNCEVSERR